MFFVAGNNWFVLAAFLGCVAFVLGVLWLHAREDDLEQSLGTETPCPQCQHANPTHANYCAQCGQRLE